MSTIEDITGSIGGIETTIVDLLVLPVLAILGMLGMDLNNP